jgi:hypothetical protein
LLAFLQLIQPEELDTLLDGSEDHQGSVTVAIAGLGPPSSMQLCEPFELNLPVLVDALHNSPPLPADQAWGVGKTVQARLGHASAAETLGSYSHLWPDSDDRTRAAVDAVLGAAADYLRTAGAV